MHALKCPAVQVAGCPLGSGSVVVPALVLGAGLEEDAMDQDPESEVDEESEGFLSFAGAVCAWVPAALGAGR